MKDLFVWFCVVFLAICCALSGYKVGYDTGARNCPVKYAVCENGTCILSDQVPDYPGIKGE